MREDAKGLWFSLSVNDTTHGNDLIKMVRDGDVTGCSFGFLYDKDMWRNERGKTIRELHKVKLVEISPVTSDAAYPAATVGLRYWDKHRQKVEDELREIERYLYSSDNHRQRVDKELQEIEHFLQTH